MFFFISLILTSICLYVIFTLKFNFAFFFCLGTSVLIMHQKNEKTEENSMEKRNSLSLY